MKDGGRNGSKSKNEDAALLANHCAPSGWSRRAVFRQGSAHPQRFGSPPPNPPPRVQGGGLLKSEVHPTAVRRLATSRLSSASSV